LRSVVVGVGLYDRIRCTISNRTGVDVTCSDPSLADARNLAVRAAECLASCSGLTALSIDLEKGIPVGGGLGGGSSDAASTLRLCDHLWGLSRSDRELAEMGAGIGSDVPLFFSLPGAVITGRGENVDSISLNWSGWVLLVHARLVVSTADVYVAWRPTDGFATDSGRENAIATARRAKELSPLLSNDLEPAVFRVCPTMRGLADRIDRLGVGPMRICGAGSTLYQLFDEEEAARIAARTIECQDLGVTISVVAVPVGCSSIRK